MADPTSLPLMPLEPINPPPNQPEAKDGGEYYMCDVCGDFITVPKSWRMPDYSRQHIECHRKLPAFARCPICGDVVGLLLGRYYSLILQPGDTDYKNATMDMTKTHHHRPQE